MTIDAVTYSAYLLQQAISDMWKLRLDPLTADKVLREEGQILGALASLKALAEDIRQANDNFKTAAE